MAVYILVTSIALVVLDTVRADTFDSAFPWLDGTRFSRAYSTSHWTVPAHASLWTGRYASEAGVHGASPTMDWPGTTLPEALQDAGYRTRCLTANPQLVQYDGWDRGFDTFDGAANLSRTDDRLFDWQAHLERTTPGVRRHLRGVLDVARSDCDTVRSLRHGYRMFRTPTYDGGATAVSERVAATDFGDNEFLFVNLMDAHTPYRPPPGERDPVTVVVADALAGDVDDPDRIRAAYAESVAHLSRVYRDIYATLRESFDYVVTLSDHGEYLGERGLWNHSIGLHPELVHVPLVVSGDDVPDRVRHDVVDLLDVHRTIADLAGVDVDSRGRNLLGELAPKPHIVESHGLLPFHHGQFERKGLPESLYDRWRTPLHGFVTENGAYAYESEPGAFRVIGDLAPSAARRRLDRLVNGLDRRRVDDADGGVSREAMNRLEELGYA